MDIKNTEERAELIWQLNKVGDYNTHKELWDAYYKLEELVKNCSINNDIICPKCKSDDVWTDPVITHDCQNCGNTFKS